MATFQLELVSPEKLLLSRAVEMAVPWTSHHHVHRTLEITRTARDSHIPTADILLCWPKEKIIGSNRKVLPMYPV